MKNFLYVVVFLFLLLTTVQAQQWTISYQSSYDGFLSGYFVDAQRGLVGGTASFRTTDGGNTWVGQSLGVIVHHGLVGNGDTVYACGSSPAGGGIIQRSINLGLSWDMLVEISGENFQGITKVDDSLIVAGSFGSIWKGKGYSWRKVLQAAYSFRGIASSGKTVVAVGIDGNAISIDGGLEWNIQYTAISTYGVSMRSPAEGFTVGADGRVFWTENFGESWVLLPSFTTTNLFGVNADADSVLTIVGNGGFVYRNGIVEHDSGTSLWWTNGTFAAGSRIILHRQIILGVNENEVPVTIELLKNYPNPFNPTTEFIFNIAKAGKASLIIYDVLGRQMSTVFDEYMEMGSHTVTWLSSLSSGTYFARLYTVTGCITSKIMILK